MPIAPDFYTAEMVRAIPEDGNRYEVLWGELLVTPSPIKQHQRIVRRLLVQLEAYCARHRLGEPFTSPADISWSVDTLVQPDVFVVAPEESTGADWASVRTLRLVVEVLSPSTARRDRFQKRKLYQTNGVGTLWLVDHDRRTVEVWTPTATTAVVESERLTWHPTDAPEPLIVELAELFG